MTKKIQNPERKEAWDEFSEFIRVRDCLQTTGLPYVGVCFTCGRKLHISALDAGHFVSGRRNAVLLVEDNVHIQCSYWCNRLLNGDPKKYRKKMIERYGTGRVEEIEALKHKVILDKEMDFPGQAVKYRRKCEKLLREHGYKTFGEILRFGRA